MKWLATTFLCLLTIASTATAQEETTVKKLQLVHDCAPAKNILPLLRDQFGERPFALGSATVTIPDGRVAEGVLMLTVNAETKTYTVNILFVEDEMMCMLTAGENFQPADILPEITL